MGGLWWSTRATTGRRRDGEECGVGVGVRAGAGARRASGQRAQESTRQRARVPAERQGGAASTAPTPERQVASTPAISVVAQRARRKRVERGCLSGARSRLQLERARKAQPFPCVLYLYLRDEGRLPVLPHDHPQQGG
ncbi:hypothetical protein FIBSPDRAFT_887277 [Athelia psychrophila]|uniref:Uncharacterized protein n=1 Tax=Athelia psychrophila TaxID=1759441 RepID=A0A166PVC9_9AGAM|nr:hypothetical protein FIBSPDRAFT_887277 [Fibularhizoctonia sp. CBS 109695]